MQTLKADEKAQHADSISHLKDNFDAIRLMAALVVLYGHSFALTGGIAPEIFGNPVSTIAVKVFFVISGYLVIESWRRDPSFVRYFLRRALRIFPGLVVVTLTTALLLGPLVTSLPMSEYFRSPQLLRYLQNMFLRLSFELPGVFEHVAFPNAVNGSLWTLPVEFVMYVVTPLILLGGRAPKLRILVGCVLLCAMSVYASYAVRVGDGTHGHALIPALEVAPYFLIGAAWRIVGPQKVFNAQVALFALFLMPLMPTGPVSEIALYLALPYAILSFSLAQPAYFSWAGRLGDFSYGVYIYAFPVQQTMSLIFHTEHRPYLNLALSLVPTLVLAALSWHFVEKRFLAFKPRRRHSGPLGTDSARVIKAAASSGGSVTS